MKHIIYTLALLGILVFGSCNLSEMNTDPNKPTETHPQLLLTQTLYKCFSEISGSAAIASRYVVETNSENAFQYYKWNRGSFSYYSNLKDVTKLIEEASHVPDSLGYIAIGHFLRAHYFYKLSLTFGDVSYFNALMGETPGIDTAKYDSQKELFLGILNELNTATEMLGKQSTLIQGDIIFNGKTTMWIKAINAFKLKVLLTLSKKESDATLNIKNQFAEIANASLMTSGQDNAQLLYLDQAGNRYPYFNNGDIASSMPMDSTFVSLLASRNDPRLLTFATQTKNAKDKGLALDDYSSYQGGDPTTPYALVEEKASRGDLSKINDRYHKNPTNEPQVVMSYSEQELILAEGIVRGWITGDAQMHYNRAIEASFDFYAKAASSYSDYLTTEDAVNYYSQAQVALNSSLSQEEQISRIITQKYIISYFQGTWTPFFEHLRTGYPVFLTSSGVTVPTRWMYPQKEYDDNATSVQEAIDRQFSGTDDIRGIPWWIK